MNIDKQPTYSDEEIASYQQAVQQVKQNKAIDAAKQISEFAQSLGYQIIAQPRINEQGLIVADWGVSEWRK